MKRNAIWCVFAFAGVLAASLQADPSNNFLVFLCFGQSNMSGGNGVTPDSLSQVTNPRIRVLAFQNCSSPSRIYNTWSLAGDPMHCGDGLNSMGPSYAFGQAMADSLPNDTIGLIPCGLWGCAIEKFMTNHTSFSSCGPTLDSGSIKGTTNAYQWVITKCKLAMQTGVFTGIILHQGESNNNQTNWPQKVDTIYNSFKKDLGLTQDVPFVAGELLQASGACCASMNTIIDKIPQALPLGYVASSAGLASGGSQPQYHFNQVSYRILGQRYAALMMQGLRTITAIKTPGPGGSSLTHCSILSGIR